jgi:hypothetical protein
MWKMTPTQLHTLFSGDIGRINVCSKQLFDILHSEQVCVSRTPFILDHAIVNIRV